MMIMKSSWVSQYWQISWQISNIISVKHILCNAIKLEFLLIPFQKVTDFDTFVHHEAFEGEGWGEMKIPSVAKFLKHVVWHLRIFNDSWSFIDTFAFFLACLFSSREVVGDCSWNIYSILRAWKLRSWKMYPNIITVNHSRHHFARIVWSLCRLHFFRPICSNRNCDEAR